MFNILNPWPLASLLSTVAFFIVGACVYGVCGTGSAQFAFDVAVRAAFYVFVGYIAWYVFVTIRVHSRPGAINRNGK